MGRLPLVALVLVAACARPLPPSTPPADEPPEERLYEVTTTVLEDESHGAMLCLSVVLESLPIQCGDVPITNWDWATVDGEERLSGTIWGDYHMVGTYDGESFTVTEVGPPEERTDPIDDDPIEAGCPEPDGGWTWPDPDRTSDEDLQAAQRVAQGEPDFSGFWIDYLDEPRDADLGEQRIVVSAAFTGDLDRHEAQIREEWGGPLCMVQHTDSYRELRNIQQELGPDEAAVDLGIQVLTSDIDVVDNVVEIHVVVLDDEDRRALDERYGPGTVRATTALQPIT